MTTATIDKTSKAVARPLSALVPLIKADLAEGQRAAMENYRAAERVVADDQAGAGPPTRVTQGVTVLQRLGKRIRALRAERGMTQETIARRAGLSRAYLARLEIGRHNPPILTLVKIAKALKVPIRDLLT
jgi:DNA-binding XRE family transcriptional regulator